MYNFQSIYSKQLEGFIEMKKALGFKCKTILYLLRKIDQYAKDETSVRITRDFTERFSIKNPNESDSYRYCRVMVLAQFCSYLSDIGVSSYIPKLPPYPKSTFVPHIFSPEEMEKIFNATDNLKAKERNMESGIFSVPVIIRLLYSTGIRISEAMSLKDEDVNINDQYLHIKDSKNHKERLIPISASLTSVCKQYIEQRNRMPITRKHGYFFIKLNGKKCSRAAVDSWFKICLQKSSIRRQDGLLPRLHDLRHTFAVTSLVGMAESGIDLYASLPILSNYLGHQSIDATNHYVRLAAYLYPSLINEINITSLNIFPKFKQYETD